MAIALTCSTALALLGLVATSIQGLGFGVDPAQALSFVPRHVGWAIPTVLLSLFSQSMVIFYFIGTGKLVKEETADYPAEQQARLRAALRRLKARTSPPATLALLSSIGVFVLGGAVHTRVLPSSTHLAAAAAAVLCHAWALWAQASAFAENHRLMADPRAFASRTEPIHTAAGGPSAVHSPK